MLRVQKGQVLLGEVDGGPDKLQIILLVRFTVHQLPELDQLRINGFPRPTVDPFKVPHDHAVVPTRVQFFLQWCELDPRYNLAGLQIDSTWVNKRNNKPLLGIISDERDIAHA